VIRPLVEDDAPVVLELQIRNRDFLAPYEPDRADDFFTLEAQAARIREAGRHTWLILEGEDPVGFVGLSNLVRGPLQSAVLSYWVDQAHNGPGLCTRAVAEVVDLAFGELALHRLEAGTLVDNFASQRVLEKNRFERYGLARRFLFIAGEWRDHVLFERTTD
jgi:[ribosomal protein S5]-alanine N-acetyltransferase